MDRRALLATECGGVEDATVQDLCCLGRFRRALRLSAYLLLDLSKKTRRDRLGTPKGDPRYASFDVGLGPAGSTPPSHVTSPPFSPNTRPAQPTDGPARPKTYAVVGCVLSGSVLLPRKTRMAS